MNPMDYLKRAIEYTEKRGDDYFFRGIYKHYRESHGVSNSVWYALVNLYDEDTALMLKYKYCETVL